MWAPALWPPSHTDADRATCTAPGGCDCIDGYSGTLCQNDDDVCGHTTPCMNGGTCNNTGANAFACSCPPGYTGVDCGTEVDACDPSIAPCQNEGLCTVSDSA